MPVTLTTADHAARKWASPPTVSSQDLFDKSCGGESKKSKRIVQTSVSQRLLDEGHIAPSLNGWVWAAIHAYSKHHHLTIRPEEIWFSILSQLGFYINAHAEELRTHFVHHQGQKELIVQDIGTIDTVDFGLLARQLGDLVQQNVKDPELQAWIVPDWTTTTDNDRTIASILMMGSMQKYFSYTCCLRCGIPSVTLLGTRSDWENILKRLDKLTELGEEPSVFASLLKPILRHFVASFDPEPSPAVLEFWGKIAHRVSGGSGPEYLSGWIAAFCFWDENGKSLYYKPQVSAHPRPNRYPSEGCELDGVFYHLCDISKIPSGFASVPVKVDDNGKEYKTTMVAGLLGMQVRSSGMMMDIGTKHMGGATRKSNEWATIRSISDEATEPPGLDSVQPFSGWFMYERNEESA